MRAISQLSDCQFSPLLTTYECLSFRMNVFFFVVRLPILSSHPHHIFLVPFSFIILPLPAYERACLEARERSHAGVKSQLRDLLCFQTHTLSPLLSCCMNHPFCCVSLFPVRFSSSLVQQVNAHVTNFRNRADEIRGTAQWQLSFMLLFQTHTHSLCLSMLHSCHLNRTIRSLSVFLPFSK